MNQLRTLGMRVGETCNFFGCEGVMKFKSIEWHELDRKEIEKCTLCECSECRVQALMRCSEA